MKLIRTEDAVGHVLCHDMTQIIKDQYKDARFRKGHIVTEADIPVLLSMGKEHLYVWEMTPGMVHENDAAERLLALCGQENMTRSEVKEGKIELKAACDGLFQVDSRRLIAVNSIEDIMIATRKGNTAVKKGDKLAGMRVIPLIIEEERLRAAEAAAGTAPLLKLLPYVKKTAAIVATGSEVKNGLIQDTFTPVVRDKLAAYGIETVSVLYSGDGVDNVANAIAEARQTGADLILCTGGMSVDPDDNTPGGIRQSGARIVTYGAPVLPGAMFLLGYFEDDTPIMGLPGCVMYAGATIFDLALPRIAAGVELPRTDANAATRLNVLAHGVQVGGKFHAGGEQTLSVLALALAEELLPPLRHEAEGRVIAGQQLHGKAFVVQLVPQRGILPRGASKGGVGTAGHHVRRALHQGGNVHTGCRDGEKPHGGEYGVSPADVIRHYKCHPALTVRQ